MDQDLGRCQRPGTNAPGLQLFVRLPRRSPMYEAALPAVLNVVFLP